MKNIKIICAALILSASVTAAMPIVPAYAANYPSVGIVTTTNGGKVVIRESPSTESKSLKLIESGSEVNVVGKEGEWYKVSFGSGTGYIKDLYIVMTSEAVEVKQDNTQVLKREGNYPVWGVISTVSAGASSNLRLREAPSIGAKVMGSMPKGSEIKILSGDYTLQTKGSKTYAWYHVSFGSYEGYACLSESGVGYDYITITATTTITEVVDKETKGWIKTNGSNLYVRNSPQYTNNRLGSFRNAAEITVKGNPVNGFYKVSGIMANGQYAEGYVCADYVTFRQPAVSSDSIITSTNGGIKLNVISYKQYNYPYDKVGNSSQSISKSGCFVTAFAMMHSYNTGTTYTPVKIQRKLRFEGACFYHDSVRNLGYTFSKSGNNNDKLKKAYEALRNGKPVVVCLSGNSTHYVTIIGFDGNPANIKSSGFIINDPGSSSNTRLSQAMSSKPTITQIMY